MHRFLLVFCSLSILACNKDSTDGTDDTGTAIDADGDGFVASEDCDDDNPDINPDADEICDEEEVDEDCDGLINDADDNFAEGTQSAWYLDGDADGYGDAESEGVWACVDPSTEIDTYLNDNSDCNDTDADINPDATEVCDDENIDEDCNGEVDDEQADVDTSTQSNWYADNDEDGYGNADDTVLLCDVPSGYVADDTDCDDTDASLNPDTAWYADTDADGFGDSAVSTASCEQPSGYVADDTDCNDTSDVAYPGADEVCDTLDNNCDGDVDEDAALDAATWYLDADSDGYGDAASADIDCDQPSGYVADATDCNDGDTAINPGATEVCDASDVDEDCSGSADDADSGTDPSSKTTYYADSDGDGYGDVSASVTSCEQPTGYGTDNTDCDDGDADINPAATEVCDGVNNDCDSSTTEDGMAQFVDSSGNVTDYTSFGGTASSPDTSAPTADGELTLCDGTYYLNWDLTSDLEIESLSGDSSAVTISGGNSGMIFRLGSYPNYGSGSLVDLELESLTLEEGSSGGTYDLSTVIGCVDDGSSSTGSSVTAENVVFEDNAGDSTSYGAIFSYYCDLDVSDSEFTGNTGEYVAAVSVWYGGDITIEDTVFDGNAAAYTSAIYADSVDTLELSGVDVYDNDITGTAGKSVILTLNSIDSVTFDDVAVYDNTSSGGGELDASGVAIGHSGTMTWTGSTSTSSGVWSNEGDGPGVYIDDGAGSLEFDTVDFDSTSSGSEVDLVTGGSSGSAYYAPDDASFICNNDRCGDDADGDGDASNDEEECEVGNASSSSATHYDYFADVVWGEVIQADTSATIESFDAYMSTSIGCSIDWYVFSSAGGTSSGNWSWTVEWASTNESITSSSSQAWKSSPHIGLPVESGTYYALAYAADCSSTNQNVGPTYENSATSTDAGFGTHVAYMYDTSSWSDKAVGDTFSNYGYVSTIAFVTNIHVTDLDAPSSGVCP